MSNYTKTTDFAAKDNLLTGNPSKIVKGSEIDTEFSNIQTAIATKADASSPVLTTPQINDTSGDHQYIFAVSELAADRTVTLPLLTGSDEFVFKDHTQTLTNKTLTNPTVTNYTETVYAPSAGTSFTVDLANGTVQKLTTNGNVTITLPSSASGKSYIIIVAYGGTHTVTWAGGGTLKWAGGSAPTATSSNGKFDFYVFTCDGTNTYGRDGGRNF